MIKHSLFKRGEHWFVDFRFDGKRYRVSTRAAKRGDAERLAEYIIRKEIEKAIGGSRFTLAELVDRYISHTRAANASTWARSKRLYLKRIVKFFGNRPLSEVTPYDCQRFQDHVRARFASQSSVNAHTTTLKNMLNLAIEWEMMTANPARKLKTPHPPGRQRFLADEEIVALLTAAKGMMDARPMGHRLIYCFIKVGLLTGMRRSEILGLRWMDFRDDFVQVRQQFKDLPKEKKPKLVPVPPGLRRELLALSTGHEYLFPVNINGLSRAWREACRRAKIRDCTPHSLRHTHATRCAQIGTSLVALQATLGHASLAMTGRYAHAQKQDQLDAVVLLEDSLPGAKMGPKNDSKKGEKTAPVG